MNVVSVWKTASSWCLLAEQQQEEEEEQEGGGGAGGAVWCRPIIQRSRPGGKLY